MRRSDIFRITFALALLASSSPWAETAATQSPGGMAVGQITYGNDSPGAAICTGALVSDRVVLTAGHCLRKADMTAMNAPDVHFAPGWKDGSAPVYRSGAEVVLSTGSGLSGDLALLVLDEPVSPETATPIPLAIDGPRNALVFVGYSRAEPDRLYQEDCRLFGTDKSILALGCDAVSGNSGAPLLQQTGNGWQLAGVMVARSRLPGPIGSYAAVPGPDIVARIAQP